MGIKRVKLEEEGEDRISDLPDPIIQHILSYLPSTKQAIRTGILSKRWRNQWTRVPILIFNSDGMSYEKQINFIDSTLILHDCSKIKKFHLDLNLLNLEGDPQIASKIGFATRKHVEDLNLCLSMDGFYLLPQFLFNNASIVKLRTAGFTLIPDGKVNWGCLTGLDIRRCKLTDQAIEHVLSGCPLLESLELVSCSELDKIVIASKYLRRLVVGNINIVFDIEISCPKLEELSLKGMVTNDPKLFAQAIERVLSGSSLLESMTIVSIYCRVLDQLVIASESLKRLVVENITRVFYIEISCPKLEKLTMVECLNVKDTRLLNLPSLLCAAIDFQPVEAQNPRKSFFVGDILQQLQHVKELKFGSWLISILSAIKVGDRFSRLLNIKCLTLDSRLLKRDHLGIAHLLHISPMLEKLVINVLQISPMLEKLLINVSPFSRKDNRKIRNSYWISNAPVFDCLVSHLKTVQIVGFCFREGDVRRQHLLDIVEFLLKNATVLEKMVVVVKDDGTGFPLEVSQELLSFPRCSQNVIIELLCSKELGNFL